jgi:hypothetical protein
MVALGQRIARGGRERGNQAVSDRSEGPEPESERSAGVAKPHTRAAKSRRQPASCFRIRLNPGKYVPNSKHRETFEQARPEARHDWGGPMFFAKRGSTHSARLFFAESRGGG